MCSFDFASNLHVVMKEKQNVSLYNDTPLIIMTPSICLEFDSF